MPATKATQSLAEPPEPYLKGWSVPQWRESLTYSQFLLHLRAGHVARVRFNYDGRKMHVTLGNHSQLAPEARNATVTVATIFDPALADKLGAAGVEVPYGESPQVLQFLEATARQLLPALVLGAATVFAVSLGGEVKANQVAFGGQALNKVGRLQNKTTFADVAGLDSIRAEIDEVVSFLAARVRIWPPGIAV